MPHNQKIPFSSDNPDAGFIGKSPSRRNFPIYDPGHVLAGASSPGYKKNHRPPRSVFISAQITEPSGDTLRGRRGRWFQKVVPAAQSSLLTKQRRAGMLPSFRKRAGSKNKREPALLTRASARAGGASPRGASLLKDQNRAGMLRGDLCCIHPINIKKEATFSRWCLPGSRAIPRCVTAQVLKPNANLRTSPLAIHSHRTITDAHRIPRFADITTQSTKPSGDAS